jgi:hypothetical protein
MGGYFMKEKLLDKDIILKSGFKKTFTNNYFIHSEKILLIYRVASNFSYWKIESQKSSELIKTETQFLNFINNN